MKKENFGHFCVLFDTPTLGCRAPPRRRSIHLGEPKPKVYALFGPPRHSSASPRQTSSSRRSIASPRSTCKSCSSSSLLLILTRIHWNNEDSNK